MAKIEYLSVLLMTPFTSPVLGAEVITGIDEGATLPFWEWQHQGVSLRLVQRLPDQTRAFFIGRGFSGEAANLVATGCVFQAVFRNDGQLPIDYDLGSWSIRQGGVSRPLVLKQAWDRKWQTLGLGRQARIAFKWAFLPNRQHFEAGDYNWGMVSFGLPPGAKFDLMLSMTHGGDPIQGLITRIQCPVEQ